MILLSSEIGHFTLYEWSYNSSARRYFSHGEKNKTLNVPIIYLSFAGNHFYSTIYALSFVSGIGPDQAPDESSGAVAQTEVIPKGVAGMYIHTT